MALQFIFGKSGSGKSHRMYEDLIRESMISQRRNDNCNYIVIVPEQSSLQTQQALIQLHPSHSLLNIDVISFTRLAEKVFDELNMSNPPILDDTGKSMVLRKVAIGKRKKLTVFKSNLTKVGFIGELKSVVSEFYQYEISKEQLDELIEETSKEPLLRQKLMDLSIVYDSFREELAGLYITAEEILEVLCTVVPKSELIKNTVFAFDGFTGFTPIQYSLLELLLVYSRDVRVVLSIDPKEDIYGEVKEHELFFMTKHTVKKLSDLAFNRRVAKKIDIIIKDEVPYRCLDNEALYMMEKYIGRFPYVPYEKDTDSIMISQHKNPEAEVGFVLREIVQLVRNENYRYKDIAIITGDLDTYAPLIEYQFNRAKLPFFLDKKKNLLSNPLVELIRATLEVIEKNFSYESVLRYLRCGLIPIEDYKVDVIENYVIALGIRGYKKWTENWERTYRRFDKERLEDLNEIRKEVIAPLTHLRNVLRSENVKVKDMVSGLYEFLVELKVESQLEEFRQEFEEKNEFLLEREYASALKKVFELFVQLVDLLGEESMSIPIFSDILDSGFEEIKVGFVPPTIDRLVIGDIERTRLSDIKALFFLGVNDGIIPKAGENTGILSDMDREILKKYKVELAPTTKQDGFTQRFYLYLMMTKPEERLYLSYSRSDREGKAIRASYLIGMVKKMFPKVREFIIDEQNKAIEDITNPQSSYDILISGLNDYMKQKESKEWRALYKWYYSQEEYRPYVLKLVEASFYEYKQNRLGREVAMEIYGNNPVNSVTRLERFAACAYAHFLAYGLELEPRQEYRLAAMDFGNIYHNSLEKFFGFMQKTGLTWDKMSVENRMQLVSESVREVTADYGNTILQSSARNRYLSKKLEKITDKTVWALGEQLKLGEFEPADSEVMFTQRDNLESMNLKLDDNMTMALQGRIDRVDLSVQDDSVLVKVIDYKSGSTSFDLTKIYHGLQLQLLIYLGAALEIEKKQFPDKEVVPAGIYYYNIKDPLVEQETKKDENNVEKQILGELRMNGLTNSNPDIIQKLDKSDGKQSQVIKKLETDENYVPTKRSMVASTDQINSLCKYAAEKAKNLGKGLVEGDISVNPYDYDKHTPCEYCEYKSVCGFDKGIDGYKYRRLKNLKPETVWEKIDKINEAKEEEPFWNGQLSSKK